MDSLIRLFETRISCYTPKGTEAKCGGGLGSSIRPVTNHGVGLGPGGVYIGLGSSSKTDPEGSSSQYSRTPAPNTIKGMVWEPDTSKIGYLDPLGDSSTRVDGGGSENFAGRRNGDYTPPNWHVSGEGTLLRLLSYRTL